MPKLGSQTSSTYLTRRRWKAEDAKQALAALERSGLSLPAFAAREGLEPMRLWRWRRQLGAQEVTAFEEIVRREAAPPLAGEGTVAVERERFEIVLRSGRVLRVPASFDTSVLRLLLAIAEEEQPC